MHDRPRAAISWSGGKDSLAALAASRDRFDVVAALTMFDESGARSRSHGLRPELVAAQADRLGLRSVTARCGWDDLRRGVREALRGWRPTASRTSVFGDLVYPEHREWAEARCAEAGLDGRGAAVGRADRRRCSTLRRVAAREALHGDRRASRGSTRRGSGVPLSAGMKDDVRRSAASTRAASAASTTPPSSIRPLFSHPIASRTATSCAAACSALDLDRRPTPAMLAMLLQAS